MKNIFIFSVILFLLAPFTFAQEEEYLEDSASEETEVEASNTIAVDHEPISISVTTETSWGADLDTEATGFSNETEISIMIPFLDGTASTGGQDTYGLITLSDLGFFWEHDGLGIAQFDVEEDDTTPWESSVEAKIVSGPIYFTVGSAPDFDFNMVDVSMDYLVDANVLKDQTDHITGGIGIGFDNSTIAFEAKVASEEDWQDETEAADPVDDFGGPFDNDTSDEDDAVADSGVNIENDYVFGADLTLTISEDINIPVSFTFDPEYNDAGDDYILGIGTAPTASIGAISIDLPLDFVLYGDQNGFEIEPALGFEFIEGGSNVSARFLYGTYTEVVSAPNALAEAGLTFTESVDTGFVDMLDLVVDFALTDLLDYQGTDAEMGWSVDVDGSYDLGGIVPFLNFGYGSDYVFDLGAGFDLTSDFTSIENTTFTISYTNDSLVENTDESIASEKGELVFTALIEL